MCIHGGTKIDCRKCQKNIDYNPNYASKKRPLGRILNEIEEPDYIKQYNNIRGSFEKEEIDLQ